MATATASPYCDNFVGNAWKRDLCLNCFKSKEEHRLRNGEEARSSLPPAVIPDPPKEGILKGSRTARHGPKGNKVNFLNDEYQVIGFGGDATYSDDDEDGDEGDGSGGLAADEDDAYENEEDKAFQKLTKSNTDYNSIPENLQEPKEGEVKKVVEPLKLGKSLLDEKGNKKTLLVSVTPFGQDATPIKINRLKLEDKATTVGLAKEAEEEPAVKAEREKEAMPVEEKKKKVEEVHEPPKPEEEYPKLVPNVSSLYKSLKKSSTEAENKPEEEEEDDEDEEEEEEEELRPEDKEVPELSRESAGEPDGKADSDEASDPPPPALPLKPPPPVAEAARTNFFHDLKVGTDFKLFSKKPKIPAKPIIVHSKKINFQSPLHTNRPKSPSIEKFLDITSSPVQVRSPLPETASGTDSVRSHKRQAPKPPLREDLAERIFSEETPESMRRLSRSTENLLELITDKQDKEDMSGSTVREIAAPEPTPRRSLSLSQDSLLSSGISEVQSKKKTSRGRFSLRKLLHLGRSKEAGKEIADGRGAVTTTTTTTSVKPKIEIIHPSEFNGARVEVLPPARASKSRRNSSSASSSSGEQKESEVLSDSSASQSVASSGNDSSRTDKAKKPVLPPRSQSLDCWSGRQTSGDRQSYAWSESKVDSLYVNLGEARSGLAPNKPVRTGSLREGQRTDEDEDEAAAKRFVSSSSSSSQPEDSGYESFDISFGTMPSSAASSLPTDDNVYECVQVQTRSSSPDCDVPQKSKRSGKGSYRRSESSFDLPQQDYFKMKFARSVSYCASDQAESDIYSPYSFYGSEAGDDDWDVSPRSLRMSRLKLKKGRSVVHKNLEDNYGAVVVANHEALAQVVDQMRQGPHVPPALRSLCTAADLAWSDFAVPKDAAGVVVERRAFYPAFWGSHPVTLCLAADGLKADFNPRGPFHLSPLAELNDLVPALYLPGGKKESSELVQASVSVLTRLQIETLAAYGKTAAAATTTDDKKEVNFVFLQIVNALKSLQARGIEEAPSRLGNFMVCREERDPQPRICIAASERSKKKEEGEGEGEEEEEEEEEDSLCRCMLNVVTDVLPTTDLTKLLADILRKEKAESLSQVKAVLEFSLWGPSDIAFAAGPREPSLQRWLDLERATVLHGLVRTRAELTVFEEWHLVFLVRTNAKMMAEASLLLESSDRA